MLFWGGVLLAVLCAACAPADREAAENGYRLYGPKEVDRLQQVLFYRALGVELGEIKALLDLAASSGGDVFRTETVELEEGLDTQEAVEALLEGLLEGPQNELLRGTLPASTTLLSAKVEGSRALVDFSAAYSTLSGVRLTMADYAVTLTLTQLPEITSVKITVQGQELVGTVEAVLYFLNEEGGLTEERRTLDLYEGDTQAAAVIRALEGAPETKGLITALPEGFRVRSVWQEEDTCYVNLSSALLGGLAEDLPLGTALDSLSRSLCSLDAVSEVRFLVDGEFEERYGSADVSEPYTV